MGLSILAAALAAGFLPQFPDDPLRFGGPKRERGIHVAPVADGGYVAVGSRRKSGQGDDVYLVRTDARGALLWSKTYGGPALDNGWAVHETPDGFVVAGFTRSFGAGGHDFYLLKTDRRGGLQWSRTYGGSGDEYCWALAPAPDGGFVLLGETTSSGAGEEDVFLVRVDGAGAQLWARTYGGAQSDRCFSLAPTADGGYVLAGQTFSQGAGDRDVYVLGVGGDGTPRWSRTFGGALSDVGHYVAPTSDGGFLVTGYTASFATAGDDPFLIALDARGAPRWQHAIPMAGTNHTLTGEQALDGGFFLVGFSDHPSVGTRAALVVKTDPEGRLEWYRDVLPTNNGETFGYTVRATSDGGCVFTGHTTVGSAGDFDLLLVEVQDE